MKSTDNKEQEAKVPVAFSEPAPVAVSIKPDAAKLKKKYNASMAEARAFAKFGAQVIKIKSKALAELGGMVEEMGVKKIGHGKILLASDNAETAISKLDDIVEQMVNDGLEKNQDLIVTLMRLKKEFNRQLIETGNAHIDAEKSPQQQTPQHPGPQLAFPAGTPMVVAIGKQPNQNQTQDKVADNTLTE